MNMLLCVEELFKSFGELIAVDNLNFKVFLGEIFGIAGPNGAGKTTLFNCITHIPYKPDSGRIIFDDTNITGYKDYQICDIGISRTFQIPAIFQSMSVFKNTLVGATFGKNLRILDSFMRAGIEDSIIGRRVIEALDFVGMLEKKDDFASELSHFDVKRLMIASALATKPKLLMLDEPVGGLSSPEIRECMTLIRKINEQGTTIIIIEHIMTALMNLADRVMILDYGKKISEGIPSEVGGDPVVIETYLGEKYNVEG